MKTFYIVANDPEAEWRCVYFDVRALSRAGAETVARVELARTKRDNFVIDLIVEA